MKEYTPVGYDFALRTLRTFEEKHAKFSEPAKSTILAMVQYPRGGVRFESYISTLGFSEEELAEAINSKEVIASANRYIRDKWRRRRGAYSPYSIGFSSHVPKGISLE